MKGLRVLECVALSSTPLGASEVAAELGMTKSNAYRTLQTLMAAKYITRRGDQPVYEPTTKLFELGSSVGNRFEVKSIARPILQEIAQKTKEDAAVVILDGREVIHLDRVNSPHLVRSMVRTGQRLPAYCSTSGKLLLAHAPDEVVDSMEELLIPFTDRTVTTLEALRADLEKIRRDGYAIVRGEWNLQVAGVAVPIRNGQGKVVAALTVSGPAERFKPQQLKAHTKVALWGAEEFRKQLS